MGHRPAFGFRLPEKLSPQRHRVTENKFSCSSFLWLRALVVKREVLANASPGPRLGVNLGASPFSRIEFSKILVFAFGVSGYSVLAARYFFCAPQNEAPIGLWVRGG